MRTSKKTEFHTPKHFFHTIQPFNVDVVFAINCSAQKTLDYMKRTCQPEKFKHVNKEMFNDWGQNNSALGRTIIFFGGFIVLIKAEKTSFRKFTAIMSHECNHVIHYMLRDRRIPLNEHTEEVYTYHQESLLLNALLKSY